jgi:hypothetical protein
MVRLVLILATAAWTSLGTTSPRYNKQQATNNSQNAIASKKKHGFMLTVFALLGIALHHLVTILEAREGHLSHRVLLMVGFVGREQRRVCGEGEMDSGETMATMLHEGFLLLRD